MVEADILRGLECKSVVRVGSESVDCLARCQRPIGCRTNNADESESMHSEAQGGAYLALYIGSHRKIDASDGRRGCHALRRALRRHTRSTVYVAGVSRSAL
jgi:hypothetical protein